MVRVNIIDPGRLADQHLVAEYNEILMLLGYVRKFPKLEDIPESYTLGKGHMRFFKDKLLYLKKRHDSLSREMSRRGFSVNRTLNVEGLGSQFMGDWVPKERDRAIIRERLLEKIRMKPDFYRYCGERKGKEFLEALIRGS